MIEISSSNKYPAEVEKEPLNLEKDKEDQSNIIAAIQSLPVLSGKIMILMS